MVAPLAPVEAASARRSAALLNSDNIDALLIEETTPCRCDLQALLLTLEQFAFQKRRQQSYRHLPGEIVITAAGLSQFWIARSCARAQVPCPARNWLKRLQDRSNVRVCQSKEPMAAALVGATRETCRAYIGHFLRHWAHRKGAHDDVLETYADNFLKPGNLEGGFAYYKAAPCGRIAMMTGEAPTLQPIMTPTCVRWAEHDPIFPYSWTDRLQETFPNLDLAQFPGVGHFAHRENPDLAAREIDGFFSRLDLR